ncbi:MAG: hypothetical protein ISS29_01850 [Candidatus Marinimicrobia bacterium]|nr:hypothetical protein [Candidatus Neomarinimicrobiota bacterium]
MSKSTNDPLIILDSDVIRHFLKGGQIHILPKLYPRRLVILDIVKSELCQSRHLVDQVCNFISFFKIIEVQFPTHDMKIFSEYIRLREVELRGDGESACMAFAKFNNHIIASSNLKDIQKYCIDNGITYLTTMDLLLEAYYKNLISKDDCTEFIRTVKESGSKLPVDTIDQYIELLNRTQ